MIEKNLISDRFSFAKLKFEHRKVIHYTLLAFVILLQIMAVIIWHNETTNEDKMSKYFDSISNLGNLKQLTNEISDSFINSQKYYNHYISNKDEASLEKYSASLMETGELVNKLNDATEKNIEFKKVLIEKSKSELGILALKSTIDSIINLQTEPKNQEALNILDFKKFEYNKILDSIKTDSYMKIDSVSKKGLFSRLGDALAGKTEVQKEQLKIIVTMKYNDKLVSGSIEDQIKNVFLTTNKYYESQFNNLKKTFTKLRNQDLKLTELNSKLLNLSATVLPNYSKPINELQADSQKKLENQYKSNITVRNYTLLILIILMFIVSIILFSFTRIAFEYEKRLTIAQDQIRQSLSFKNRIMGMISHEIRSPLSIISMYSKKISSSIQDIEIKDTFKSIQFTTNSLLLLSNQILEYSKEENYELKLKNKNFHLKTEINQIIDSLSSLVETKGNKIELNSNLNSDDEVYSDATKIHQLFYNIVGNANKFTENGRIAITIDLDKNSDYEYNLKIEIQDTGAGIPEENLKNIFDLYYQGNVSNKMNDLGVGLGLNLCKEIVELFDGEINVESEEGKGTKVVFNLILSPA
ncbi:HAMP domain-containing sensor histidine kinase [Flavobacterium sp. 140616W15]|uniref:sensor histidine kinase n=1 Tax=Flavobacterium sp. 140616W15 TaxID=2478552 RepID=UPI000F0C1649|nr:HAMP domain-containing sensor histidine kinase [Flavobacterium sp. 140616W15]AYN04010.1 sensor histidine kinase [Flavobacterium sp. 140616W15]